jgi:hypothetical protein
LLGPWLADLLKVFSYMMEVDVANVPRSTLRFSGPFEHFADGHPIKLLYPARSTGTTTPISNSLSLLARSTESGLPKAVRKGLSKAEIGGIVGGVLGGLLIVLALAFFLYWRRQKRSKKRQHDAAREETAAELAESESEDVSSGRLGRAY